MLIHDLIEDMINLIEALFHHDNFEAIAGDVIKVAQDGVNVAPEALGDKHVLLADAIQSVMAVAQDRIVNK